MFSFLGVCSSHHDVTELQKNSLNLFQNTCEASRATAGTTVEMPGATNYHEEWQSKMSPVQHTELPSLLAVSCGYFKNIVLKVLFK